MDPRAAHTLAPDREMDRRFADIYGESTTALFCDPKLADRVGTSGVGYYAHYVPQLHPDSTDVPITAERLRTMERPVLLIKPACDYVPWIDQLGRQSPRMLTPVVALELGIPAVVGCGNATARLKTGDRVRVDGSAGMVQPLDG